LHSPRSDPSEKCARPSGSAGLRLVPRTGRPRRRAARLLSAHLDAAQLDEYRRGGVVTVERRGPVASVLARNGALALLAAAAAASLPLALGPALVILVALPLLAPAFLIACWPRRVWRIDPERGPQLVGRRVRVDFCVRFDEPLPSADRILAFKNLLEAAEAHFLRTANVERVRLNLRRPSPAMPSG
jgi:hypothetical protein